MLGFHRLAEIFLNIYFRDILPTHSILMSSSLFEQSIFETNSVARHAEHCCLWNPEHHITHGSGYHEIEHEISHQRPPCLRSRDARGWCVQGKRECTKQAEFFLVCSETRWSFCRPGTFAVAARSGNNKLLWSQLQ